MKIQSEWIKWEPIHGLAKKYDIESIVDGKNGLVIRLYSDNKADKKVEIIFKNYVDAYRHTNESFRINTIHALANKYDSNFYGDWTFFMVKDSEYLRWLSQESSSYADMFPFIHFCFLGVDSIVDVLARYEPVVIFV